MTSIHPFPARMAPELALNTLASMPRGSTVLDPMTGSGTVARQAREFGLRALGFDLDPLAVLMSKVATTPVNDNDIEIGSARLLAATDTPEFSDVALPWIDGHEDAERFISFWFGAKQETTLRRIAYLLAYPDLVGLSVEVADVLRIALSRIIVTKGRGASLAEDTSHSRPHKVVDESDYDVRTGFERSIKTLRKRLSDIPAAGDVTIRSGDARKLSTVPNSAVDAVLTSPPYLNAIDYMRGHRMSLIWLGHKYADLSSARSASIGAERKPDKLFDADKFSEIKIAMGSLDNLPNRYQGMIERYVVDLHSMVSEIARVLKPKANATFVMGNSCLKGVFIQNSEAMLKAAEMVGLTKVDSWERDLPSGSRYLPTPKSGFLSKRMRKEVILRMTKPA